ncbi:MAG: substrate-binding domain-containing protein [Helicobacteraceae bacterium]|nr:substrate-binding domain-containing protein [Helicobacteraceae bacterium]
MADQNNETSGAEAGKLLSAVWRFLKLNNYMWSLIYAPIVAQLLVLCYLTIDDNLLLYSIVFCSIVTAIAIAILGYFRSKKLEVKDGYFTSYFPLFLPVVIVALQLSVIYAAVASERFLLFIVTSSAIISYLEMGTTIVYLPTMFAFEPVYFSVYILTVSAAYAFGFFLGLRGKNQPIVNKKPIYLSAFIALIAIAPASLIIAYINRYVISDDLQKLSPIRSDFIPDAKIQAARALIGEPTIYFEDNLPKLDGTIALYPVYSAAAKAIYKKPDNLREYEYTQKYIACSLTNDALRDSYFTPIDIEHIACLHTKNAYYNLINKLADLIFVAEPSQNRLKISETSDVSGLALTPIGKEAFVFLVNENNPIGSLTIEQLQKIYTGEITNWREVGGEDETILAFQRKEYSDIQTTMANTVMKGLKLKTPPQETVISVLPSITVADYRNAENAIGYSFRFFVTDMQETKGVRLLAINGVEPTPENIANGSYPLTQEFYIVARKDDITPNAQKLIDWFLSDQGQALIKDVGYIPLKGF